MKEVKKELGGEVKKFHWKSWIFLATVVLVVIAVLFFILDFEDCKNKSCFDNALKSCDRAKLISGDDMVFKYVIKGGKDGGCEVSVKLLQGNLDDSDSAKLEGREMVCILPLGVVMYPESDIGACHGLLKEGLQDLIIEKLNTYLVQNLGQLNLEIAGLPAV